MIWVPTANLTTNIQTLHDDDLNHLTEASLSVLECLRNGTGKNHWAVQGWRGYTGGLWSYFLQACKERQRRGEEMVRYMQHASRVVDGIDVRPLMPRWFGYRAVHTSHASRLIHERPTHYAQCWPEVPLDMALLWPINKRGQFDFSLRLQRSERQLLIVGDRWLPDTGDFLGRME